MTTMISSSILFLFSPIFFQLVLTLAELKIPPLYLCLGDDTLTINSTYKSNLDNVLISVSLSPDLNFGFSNSSFGQGSDQVYAIALCRGDKSPEDCRSCISVSVQAASEICPIHKEAIFWYDDCMLRYSNKTLYGQMEYRPYAYSYNINNVSNSQVTQYHMALSSLLDYLTDRAASGNQSKFAAGRVTTIYGQTLYAMVQCTPELSRDRCADCLGLATQLIVTCCNGKRGGRVVAPSCQFRYERYLFFDPHFDSQFVPQTQQPAEVPVSSPKIIHPSSSNTKGQPCHLLWISIPGVLSILLWQYLYFPSAINISYKEGKPE